MDPYLEHPNVFPNLHDRLIVYLEEEIQPKLPESYFAKGAQRVWLEYSESTRIPDVSMLRTTDPSGQRPAGGGTAVAEVPVKIPAPSIASDEFHESFLEIYVKSEGEPRLVTALEILSPINKTPGKDARGEYRKKQRQLLQSQVHLIEIDFLRAGVHTTAVPQDELLKRCGRVDYHICAHYFDQPDDFFVYPIQLWDKLPNILIPLLPGDDPVTVELQPLFDRCYDRGPYQREINYANDPPPPPLTSEKLAWVKSVLTLRTARN